jgi:hypothetical protein
MNQKYKGTKKKKMKYAVQGKKGTEKGKTT